jgi:hypothetical protein
MLNINSNVFNITGTTMNYCKIYTNFMEYVTNTSPFERMVGRNKNDFRKDYDKLYTESHHILPKSLGGTDDPTNLVVLLPEEHLFIHALRYKAFNTPQDFIAVRLIINGMNTNSRFGVVPDNVNKKILSTYAWMKQNSATFRYEHGWQTEDGRRRISEARKNTMPVKCAITGEMVGTVPTNHPKVISGDWVHHSKGKHTYKHILTGEKIYCNTNDDRLNSGDWTSTWIDVAGELNPRFSGVSDDDILEFYRKLIRVIITLYDAKHVPGIAYTRKIWNAIYDKKLPHLSGGIRSGFRFNGDIYENLYKKMESEFNVAYSMYNKETKKFNITEVINAIN